MAENLSCEETSDSWITDNDDEINCVGGFMSEIDYYNSNQLFSKNDNFHRSIRMIKDSNSLLREVRIREMLEREVEFFPGTDYIKRLRSGDFELLVRNQALDWIIKVCAHYNFGPLCICLSLNYLDRFLTCYEFPKNKAWVVQLLAVSCLSLAAKMEETDVPQTLDLQVEDPKFVFEAKMIKRMELLILNTLSWRLQALTPFSFIDYFINKISGQVLENSMYKSSQFILNTLKDIDFLDFRPSEIAAAAAVSVSISGETKCIYDLIYVKQERVKRCLNLMRNLTEESLGGASFSPKPESPIGVLEATCLSEERRVESCTNSSESSPENNSNNKRRRKQ